MDVEKEIRALTLQLAKQAGKIEMLEAMVLSALAARPPVEPAPVGSPRPVAPRPDSRLAKVREQYPNHGKVWDERERAVLLAAVRGDAELEYDEMPDRLGRSSGALKSEVFRLRRRNILTDLDLQRAGITGYDDWLARQG